MTTVMKTIGIGAALGCALTAGTASAQSGALFRAKPSYNYTLVYESTGRVTCVKYPSDCAYIRSPNLSDTFEALSGFRVSADAINQPVGW